MALSKNEIAVYAKQMQDRGDDDNTIAAFIREAEGKSSPDLPVPSFVSKPVINQDRQLANRLSSAGKEFFLDLASEAEKQYVNPIAKMATGNFAEGGADLYKNIKPSIRMSPLLLNLSPQYRAAKLGSQALMSSFGFAGSSGLTGATPKEQAITGISAFASSYNPAFKAASSELARRGQYLGTSILGALTQGGTEVAAEIARGKDLKESFSSAKIPAVVGSVFGLTGQLGKTFEVYAEESQKAKAAFGVNLPIVVQSPTVFGSVGIKAENLGTDIGVAAIERKVGSDFIESLGNQVDGAEIVQRLQPYVGQVDESIESLASLSRESLLANEALLAARAALSEARNNAYTITNARKDVLVANLKEAANRAAAVQARAIANNAYQLQQLRLKENYVAPADARKFFVEKVVTPLQSHVKNQAKILQDAIDIPSTQEFISGKDISNSIKNTPAYVNAGAIRRTEMDSIFNPFLVGKDKDDKEIWRNMSRDDIQYTRQKLWDLHESDLPNVPQLETAALKQMDGAIQASVESAVEQFKPESLAALREFNSYWSRMSEARSSKSVRAFLVKEPNDEIIQNLTKKLIDNGSNSQEYTGLIKYIDAVAGGDPGTQQEMKSHVFGLVRDNLITRNFGSNNPLLGPIVNLENLSSDLQKLKKGGFPVIELNLDPDFIQATSRMANNAGIGKNITGAEFAAIMQNPAVVQARRSGQKIDPILTKVVYELGAIKAFKESRLNEIVGRTKAAQKNMDIAEERAKRAGIDLAVIEQKVGDLKKNPIAIAMAGGKAFGINAEGQSDFKEFLSYIGNTNRTTGADVTNLLSGINEVAPEMREQIALHTLSNVVEFLSKNQSTGERGVNWVELGKLIDPSNPISGEMTKNRLRLIVGDEAFSKLMDNMPRINIIQGINRQRQAVSTSGESLSKVGITSARATNRQGSGTTIKAIGDLIGQGEYKIASMIMLIPGAERMLKSGASITDIINKLGPQRAYIMYQNMPKDQQDQKDKP